MEEIAKAITIYISHTLEIIAALAIAAGLLELVINYFNALAKDKKYLTAEEARIKFGSAVAMALELLLGADVLATAVSPSWDDMGKLAAIATIRTILNYFLERELKHMHLVKKTVP
jgi:uncharacterized membrane protein